MSQFSLTSLVYNSPYSKQLGLPKFYYRTRSCNTKLTGFTPAEQYQRLKIIQNTVRVYGSLYTSNLGSLTAYKKPITDPDNYLYGVCWNQMSDRPIPSVQKATVPTGYATSMNQRKTSVTSSRPGCQTPGGVGCDIKHNSYDRYLNRLKGKGPLRRGIIPNEFGKPIQFNPAFPIYGGKTTKTNIVNNCDCPIETSNTEQNLRIFNNPLWYPYPVVKFNVGNYVYAIKNNTDYYSKATITDINGDIYTIIFHDGTIQEVENVNNNLLIYFPCNCSNIKQPCGKETYMIYGGGIYRVNCGLTDISSVAYVPLDI